MKLRNKRPALILIDVQKHFQSKTIVEEIGIIRKLSTFVVTFDRIGVNGENYDSEIIHLTTIANLNEEFATIWDFEKLMAEI